VAAALIVVGGAYFLFFRKGEDSAETQQITASVTRGLLVSSVSGTGQVQTADSVDLKPGASDRVVQVAVKEGDTVSKGQLLVRLDSSDVAKAVRDAETNLDNAKLKLAELYEPPTELQMLQKENQLISAQESLEGAEQDLVSAYEDAYNQVSDAFLDLPSVMTGLEDILFGGGITDGQSNIDAYDDLATIVGEDAGKYRDDAQQKSDQARDSFDVSFDAYKSSSRYDSEEDIMALLTQTYDTARDLAEAVKAARNLVDFVQNALTTHDRQSPSAVNSHKSALSGHMGTVNGQVSSLSSRINGIRSAEDRIVSAERTLRERELEMEDLKAGPDEADISAQELTIRQREDDLLDAKTRYADYVIYAPFDGVVAEVGAEVGQDISSGTVAVQLVSDATIAEIQFNEVDVTGIEPGQRADITFDAVTDYTVTGEVVEVDMLGTTSQGVVSFGVTIAFDSDDSRIKPGMSLTANIITSIKENVLTVPNTAIKYQGDSPYVEVVEQGGITRRNVVLGASNDLRTEVASGLEEGEELIVSAATSDSDSFNGGPPGGGFMVPGVGGSMRGLR